MKWDVGEVIVKPRRSHAKESPTSCVGVGGPVVSRHYDLIIADDLIDEDNDGTTPWPEKFTVDWLKNRRLEMGTVLFNGQYQNDVQAMITAPPARRRVWRTRGRRCGESARSCGSSSTAG